MKQEVINKLSLGIGGLALFLSLCLYTKLADTNMELHKSIRDGQTSWNNQVRLDQIIQQTFESNGMWKIDYKSVPGAVNLQIH